ncbi:hypothetical protein [Candidatus Deianiraea vastatrix]|nr:hypothetical protein [Candidatus Deianiraea vastatrix]
MFNDDMRKRLCEENEFPAIKSRDFAEGVRHVNDLCKEILSYDIIYRNKWNKIQNSITDPIHKAFYLFDYYCLQKNYHTGFFHPVSKHWVSMDDSRLNGIKTACILFDDEFELEIIAKYANGSEKWAIFRKGSQEINSGIKKELSHDDEIIRIKNKFYSASSTFEDRKNAIEDLCNYLEKNGRTERLKKELNFKGETGKNCDAVSGFFNFVNNCNIRHAFNATLSQNNPEPTENQLQIFFDFGLSLARFANSIDEKAKNSIDKTTENSVDEETDCPF